jgi:hypothetical protein
MFNDLETAREEKVLDYRVVRVEKLPAAHAEALGRDTSDVLMWSFDTFARAKEQLQYEENDGCFASHPDIYKFEVRFAGSASPAYTNYLAHI